MLNPGSAGYGGTTGGANPYAKALVGNLLSRTRQLTSEAIIEGEDYLMKNTLRKISGAAIITGCIGILSTGVFADSLLKEGVKCNEVYLLQNKLKSISYANFNSTGYYGSLTKNAVKKYQKDYGLVSDGMAGYRTLAKLGLANATTYLVQGNRGSEVTKLQNALNSKGFSVGKADGIFGSKTRGGVINFQKAKGLTSDGIAGPITQTNLYNADSASRGAAATSYSSDDLYWMSRIIHAEAEAEPYSGKVAVGNVILNRKNLSGYPNTVKGVIFDYWEGIPQFSPVASGTIYNNPNEDSIKAAKEAFNGSRPVGACTHFFNPDKAAGNWIVKNKTYVMRIGNHVFYK